MMTKFKIFSNVNNRDNFYTYKTTRVFYKVYTDHSIEKIRYIIENKLGLEYDYEYSPKKELDYKYTSKMDYFYLCVIKGDAYIPKQTINLDNLKRGDIVDIELKPTYWIEDFKYCGEIYAEDWELNAKKYNI